MGMKRVVSLGMSIPSYSSSDWNIPLAAALGELGEMGPQAFSNTLWDCSRASVARQTCAENEFEMRRKILHLHQSPPHSLFDNTINIRKLRKICPDRGSLSFTEGVNFLPCLLLHLRVQSECVDQVYSCEEVVSAPPSIIFPRRLFNAW